MATKEVTVKEVCRRCGGTGVVLHPWAFGHRCTKKELEIGFVCPSCQGKGYTEHTYEPFEGRKTADGIKNVFSYPNKGIISGDFDMAEIARNAEVHLVYSISYAEWIEGKEPPEWIESFYCPFDIFSSEHFTNYYENPCSKCDKCRKKSKGKYFSDKSKCWEEVKAKIANGETFPKRIG